MKNLSKKISELSALRTELSKLEKELMDITNCRDYGKYKAERAHLLIKIKLAAEDIVNYSNIMLED